MTLGTQRDQVVFGVGAGSAAKLFVMNLEVFKTAAALALPSIPTQDF
ncbi:MAG: hypothetical protein WA383_21460 [Terriglobales bacterium]